MIECRASFVALTEKQLPFEIRTLDLAAGENNAADYAGICHAARAIFYRPVSAPLSSAAQIASRKLCAGAAKLLSHGGKNLFGRWSIADVDLAVMLNRLILNGDDIPLRLVRYARAQWPCSAGFGENGRHFEVNRRRGAPQRLAGFGPGASGNLERLG
jgi:glutathione S-transferase